MGAIEKNLSPFIDDYSTYKQDRDILNNWFSQAARFLSAMKGYDYEKTLEFLIKHYEPGNNGVKEKRIAAFIKNRYGDRERKVLPFTEYLEIVEEKNYHLSPSLVAYTHTDEEESVNAVGTLSFINDRSFYKDLRQTVPKGTDDWTAFNEIQNALKIFNNAQSGAMSSGGTSLANKSGHTTLTSTTRCLTSTVNIFNEKLICGNRLLLTYDKTMELFISTLEVANRELIQSVINKYELSYATVPQLMSMVRRCSYYYFRNEKHLKLIEEYLSKLTPLDLTILLCNTDLVGLTETNRKFITAFLDDWIHIPEFPENIDENQYPKPSNGDYYNLCVFKLGSDFSKGQLHYLNKYHLDLEEKYEDFINAFFKTPIPPSGIYSVGEMVREAVPVSDTDSSVYSLDSLTKTFNYTGDKVRVFTGVMGYFIRNIAVDQHGRLSKNMNVSNKYARTLTMKPEYSWSASFTCLISKHYWSLEVMVEGVLNKEKILESKGVNIKGSKAPALIKEFREKLMMSTLEAAESGKYLDPSELLFNVAEMERAVIEDTLGGSPVWLEANTIKSGEVYSNEDSSVYYYHKLWEEVFAEKYGRSEALPYRAYKVPLVTTNKTKYNELLASMSESDLGKRLAKFSETARDTLAMFYIPMEIAQHDGLPKEMIPHIDTRTLISQNLKSVYIILETLGLHILNDKVTRLISDEH